jgi:hypothetical protein
VLDVSFIMTSCYEEVSIPFVLLDCLDGSEAASSLFFISFTVQIAACACDKKDPYGAEA